jgi:hypothetical protein
MAITYKILGQSNPTAQTVTTLYTVPSSTSAIVSTISVCNQVSSSGTFRLAVRPTADSLAAKHYINYDTTIPANDTLTLTLGITLGAADLIVANTSSSNISFSIFGSEVT